MRLCLKVIDSIFYDRYHLTDKIALELQQFVREDPQIDLNFVVE